MCHPLNRINYSIKNSWIINIFKALLSLILYTSQGILFCPEIINDEDSDGTDILYAVRWVVVSPSWALWLNSLLPFILVCSYPCVFFPSHCVYHSSSCLVTDRSDRDVLLLYATWKAYRNVCYDDKLFSNKRMRENMQRWSRECSAMWYSH